MRTFYCSFATNRLSEITTNYPVVKEYLQPDEMIIVDGGSTDGSLEFLNQLGVLLVHHQWTGDFVAARNAYMDVLEELAEDGDLIVTSDTDEYLQPSVLSNLRQAAEDAYLTDANFLRIRCRSEWTNKHGALLYSTLDDYRKPLVSLWEAGGRYVGAGGRPIHEELHYPSGRRFVDISDENGTMVYIHRKVYGVVWARAIRNFYIAGLDPSGILIPEWEEFKALFARQGLLSWPEVDEYLQRGLIAKEVKEWLIARRHHPIGEVKNSFLGYFVFLHPEEMPAPLLAEYAEEIRKVQD